MILDGRSQAQKIQDAIDFLRKNGYAVRGPLLRKTEVQTPAQLVRFFYDTMVRFHPERMGVGHGNMARERGVAKSFIDSRVRAGLEKSAAVAECCSIIEFMFAHEERLGLNFIITSMQIFASESLSWFIEKVISMKEGLDSDYESEKDRKYFEELYNKQNEEVDDATLEEASVFLDKVLQRYAEKEKRNGK